MINDKSKNVNRVNTTATAINNFPSDNVVRISFDTDTKKAINYVMYLFTKKKCESVVICGLSLALSKVILIAEIVKTKVKNIHQINRIDCLLSKDKFDESKIKRVPKLDILLTLKEPQDKGSGYQQPLGEEEFAYLASMKNVEEDFELEEALEEENNGDKDKERKKYTFGHRRKGPKWRRRRR